MLSAPNPCATTILKAATTCAAIRPKIHFADSGRSSRSCDICCDQAARKARVRSRPSHSFEASGLPDLRAPRCQLLADLGDRAWYRLWLHRALPLESRHAARPSSSRRIAIACCDTWNQRAMPSTSRTSGHALRTKASFIRSAAAKTLASHLLLLFGPCSVGLHRDAEVVGFVNELALTPSQVEEEVPELMSNGEALARRVVVRVDVNLRLAAPHSDKAVKRSPPQTWRCRREGLPHWPPARGRRPC